MHKDYKTYRKILSDTWIFYWYFKIIYLFGYLLLYILHDFLRGPQPYLVVPGVEISRLDSVRVSFSLNDLGLNSVEFFLQKVIRKMLKFQNQGVFNPLIMTQPEVPRLLAIRDYSFNVRSYFQLHSYQVAVSATQPEDVPSRSDRDRFITSILSSRSNTSFTYILVTTVT